jgi:TPP-dependent pyruvate/acetoin dehydrogenase alpha subunit
MELYRVAATIRCLDQQVAERVRIGELKAATYGVRGLEVACAALGLALGHEDRMVSTYRNLGDAVAKGMSVAEIVAEFYGKAAGPARGKGGPMHLSSPDVGFMMTTGIVGSGLPIATGLAWAAQLDSATSRIVVVTFGDAATSIGAAHEALNLAASWKLPILFFCQNNQWGEHTPIVEYTAQPDLALRAAAYGMKTCTLDGFDHQSCLSGIANAVESVRESRAPMFLNCVTYRLTPHSSAMDMSEMPESEVAAAMERDPVPALRSALAESESSVTELMRTDSEISALVERVFSEAASAAAADSSHTFADVFASIDSVNIR